VRCRGRLRLIQPSSYSPFVGDLFSPFNGFALRMSAVSTATSPLFLGVSRPRGFRRYRRRLSEGRSLHRQRTDSGSHFIIGLSVRPDVWWQSRPRTAAGPASARSAHAGADGGPLLAHVHSHLPICSEGGRELKSAGWACFGQVGFLSTWSRQVIGRPPWGPQAAQFYPVKVRGPTRAPIH
jgi:hypothetical protein